MSDLRWARSRSWIVGFGIGGGEGEADGVGAVMEAGGGVSVAIEEACFSSSGAAGRGEDDGGGEGMRDVFS